MSFLPLEILHRFFCSHKYVSKEANFYGRLFLLEYLYVACTVTLKLNGTTHAYTHTHTHTYIYIYIYIYLFIYLYLYIERERARETDRQIDLYTH